MLITNLDRFIRAAPASASLYGERAEAHADLGRWKQAAADGSSPFSLWTRGLL